MTLAAEPLKRHLFMLTAASIVPLAVMAAIGLYALRARQQAGSERVGVELARLVANAVDAELRATVSILETLATSQTLDQGDVSGFRERALRVLAVHPDWIGIQLTAVDGQPLDDTRVGENESPLPIAEAESLLRVVRTGMPVVGPLTAQAGVDWWFSVRVPVRRGSDIVAVVTALLKPDAIRQVLLRQDVPDDWVISIIDSSGRRVARSRAHEENLGGRLSDTAQQVVDGGAAEGVGIAYALEGERILTPYSRLASSGWVAVLGIPTSVVGLTAYRVLALYGLGVILSIVLGMLTGLRVSRRVTRPIRALGRAAAAMARHQRPEPPETSIREINEAGHALSAAFDELRRGEAERNELLRKERRAREAAESSDRAKDQFLAVLSHELRTPLNAVSGWAKMLQRGQLRDDPAAAERAQNAIVRNADVQLQLIDDLLDLSRISTGKLRLRVRRVELSVVLRSAIDAVRPAAEAKQIALHTTFDPEGIAIVGDPDRLQQVGWNLLMNAVKFTPKGGTVDVDLRRRQSQVEIVVRDTGRGIGADELPHVFDRFQQADSSSTRAHGGLGLGLALVRNLVELHGGTVIAASDGVGHGAAFTVTLPVAATHADFEPVLHESGRHVAAAPPSAGAGSLTGRRLLVVDDDVEGMTLVDTVLSRAGADVQACPSAAAALALFPQFRPDVLVSDIEMPEEDGYSLIRKIRALPVEKGGLTPAIALTAYGRAEDRKRALEAGFDRYIRKPVDPDELTRLVSEVYERPGSPHDT